MYTGINVPPPPRAVPLPRHTGEASGSNGIIASLAYGGSGERSEPKGALPPPSVIDTDIFILHPRRNGVQYTITKIHAKKRKTSSKKPTEEKLISSSVGFCTEATMPVPLFYVSYSYTTML